MFNIFNILNIILLSCFVKSQNCNLQVPNDPLNTGLFKPWYLSTKIDSLTPCSQSIEGFEVFVEATIFDLTYNNFYVYVPLVIDLGTIPAVPPIIGQLPKNSIVVIHFGTNANSITLLSSMNGVNSLDEGICINGLNGSVFGQFAYCNAHNFFKVVNERINNGLVFVPPIGNTILGDECPTTRSFSVVDQDQSDNLLSQYILTTNMQVAQDTNKNRVKLSILRIITNGSDNRLLSNFINVAVGCKSFTVPDLVDKCCTIHSSVALNEIQANLKIPSRNVALIPSINPMVLLNGTQSLEKTNLYRIGVNQPLLLSLNIQDNINYCIQLQNIGIPFFIKYMLELSNINSPNQQATSLLNFLCNRFVETWSILGCTELTDNICPVTVQIVNNIVISNNLNLLKTIFVPNPTMTSYINPVTTPGSTRSIILDVKNNTISPGIVPVIPTDIPNTNPVIPILNLCGNSYNNVNCSQPCLSGLDTECSPNYFCFRVEKLKINCNIVNFCGSNYRTLNCLEPCPSGYNKDCKSLGFLCFKDLSNICIDIMNKKQDNITITNSTNTNNTNDFIPLTSNSKFLNINYFLLITFLNIYLSILIFY